MTSPLDPQTHGLPTMPCPHLLQSSSGMSCPPHQLENSLRGRVSSLASSPAQSPLHGVSLPKPSLCPAQLPSQGDSPHCQPSPPSLLSVLPLSPLSLEDWRAVWPGGQLPGQGQLSGPRHGQPETPAVCRDRDGGAGVTCVLGGLPSGAGSPPPCSSQHQQR